MAPWPEQGNPKSKSNENRASDVLKSKSEPPEDKKCVLNNKDEDQLDYRKDVHSLDDGQLKALLDEAIQYKCPKDREGKSKIFRELLQKVEDAEEHCVLPRAIGGRRAIRRDNYKVSERSSRGGSLQNIFHAANFTEFESHHSGGSRRKSKRQGPGSSVSARQREGGSLPSNVNTNWGFDSWQTDQITKALLFDTPPSYSSPSCGSTQARRQTLMHSASNEIPSTRKQNTNELYPLRRHHSSSDQSRSTESYTATSSGKHKSHSESSATIRKMPQVTKPDYVSLDMGGLNLEMKTLSTSTGAVSNNLDPTLTMERKMCPTSEYMKADVDFNDVYRLTPNDIDGESTQQEVYTTRASLEVEPVVEVVTAKHGMVNGVDNHPMQLDDSYPAVHSLCETARIVDVSNQVIRMDNNCKQAGLYPNVNTQTIRLVNISSTDENGNVTPTQQQQQQQRLLKKNKRKQQSEKNVVLSRSDQISGYRGNDPLKEVLSFIENDKTKQKQLKKPLNGKNNKKHDKKQHNTTSGNRNGLKKSNSLEEISQRNIDDLTECAESERSVVVRKPRKQSVSEEVTGVVRERRSWGDQVYVRSESQNDLTVGSSNRTSGKSDSIDAEFDHSDSEFQMVTKKQRKRKTNENTTKRTRSHRNNKRSPRRKSTSSVPPSEKSGDSEVDSVHSLPVGDSRGQVNTVSYADITAGNANYRLDEELEKNNNINIKHGNPSIVCDSTPKNQEMIQEWCDSVTSYYHQPLPPSTEPTNPPELKDLNTLKLVSNNINNNNNSNSNNNNNNNNNNINNEEKQVLSKDEFPSLPVKQTVDNNNKKINNNIKKSDKSVLEMSKSLPEVKDDIRQSRGGMRDPITPRATRSKSVGRPPVILLHDNRDNNVCGITFGFEINEQLLSNSTTSEPGDVSVTSDNPSEITSLSVQELFKQHKKITEESNSNVKKITTTFIPPPADMPIKFNHDKIVTFVGMAWEDVMRHGEICYYSEDN